MSILLKEVFCGIEIGYYRKDLLLDHILGQLDLGLDHFQQHKPGLNEFTVLDIKNQYRSLKGILLEVDGEATDEFNHEHPRSAIFFSTNFHKQVEGATQHSCVQFLFYIHSCISSKTIPLPHLTSHQLYSHFDVARSFLWPWNCSCISKCCFIQLNSTLECVLDLPLENSYAPHRYPVNYLLRIFLVLLCHSFHQLLPDSSHHLQPFTWVDS